MRSKVPDHADIRLVEAEIYAARRNEVDVAELAVVDQGLDHRHGGAVQERVPRHHHQPGALRARDEIRRFLHGSSERFLDKDVFPGVQGGCGQLVVCGDGGRYCDRVERIIGQQRVEAPRPLDAWKASVELRESTGIDVAYPREFCFGQLVKVPDEVRAPVPEPDDGHPHGFPAASVVDAHAVAVDLSN